MSDPFFTTREVRPCIHCGDQPTLGSRYTGDGIRFELSCACGANVYSRHEIGIDAYRAVDALAGDWNRMNDES